jgi:ribosomal protein S15P/S13E
MTYPTYSKYTFVCTGDCDALIEYTFKDGLGWPNGVVELTCPCGSKCTYLSVQDATIPPIKQTKEEKMETTFGATVTPMSDVDVLKERVKGLEEHIQRLSQRDYATASTLNKMRDNMKEFTMEGLDDDSISEYQAEEIASICGFELTTEFEIDVTVQYSITVNARDEESAMNAIYDIDFDSVSFNDSSISYLSSSMDRMEVQ